LVKYDWFKHGDHIRKRRARKEHQCAICGNIVRIKEFYVSITGLTKDLRFSGIKICLKCFFPDDWVEDLKRQLRLITGV
jgi:hypothetical protein